MQALILAGIPATTALIGLALGYIVLTVANKEKGGLKTIGQIIGVSIIVIGASLILLKILWVAAFGIKTGGPLIPHKMMQQQQVAPGPKK